jgi:hypothetical protein
VNTPSIITAHVAQQVISEHQASAARAHRADGIVTRMRRFRGRRAAALHGSVPRGRPSFPSAAR